MDLGATFTFLSGVASGMQVASEQQEKSTGKPIYCLPDGMAINLPVIIETLDGWLVGTHTPEVVVGTIGQVMREKFPC